MIRVATRFLATVLCGLAIFAISIHRMPLWDPVVAYVVFGLFAISPVFTSQIKEETIELGILRFICVAASASFVGHPVFDLSRGGMLTILPYLILFFLMFASPWLLEVVLKRDKDRAGLIGCVVLIITVPFVIGSCIGSKPAESSKGNTPLEIAVDGSATRVQIIYQIGGNQKTVETSLPWSKKVSGNKGDPVVVHVRNLGTSGDVVLVVASTPGKKPMADGGLKEAKVSGIIR